MPTEYKRKGSVCRGEWSEQDLQQAIEAVQEGRVGVREAVRSFGVPYTTLRRRLRSGNHRKLPLGPLSTLGQENEVKLVNHIKKLQKFGFSPSRTTVRSMAFELAQKLNLPYKFNIERRMAGYPWIESFLRRNKDLAVRKSEARIYNVDETGLQMNNKPGFVIAQRGSKNVSAVTSAEKGETISVITSCNAEGSFIPPTCIFKGKNQKPEFADGIPPGSLVFMSEKSAYVNNVLFLRRNPNRRINRLIFGQLLAAAWEKSATVKNAVSSFRATGIVPFNPSAIPDYAYLTDKPQGASPNEPESQVLPNVDNRNESAQDSSIIEILESVVNDSAGPSDTKTPEKEIDTPGKILDKINPIPITEAVSSARKRGGQLASVLTSSDNIRNKKKKLEEKLQAEAKKRKKKENKKCIKPGPSRVQSKFKKRKQSTSSFSEEEIIYDDSSEYEDETSKCGGCRDFYSTTTKMDDWIQCVTCPRWVHEGCTRFDNFCDACGKSLQ
ncbi:unnamed protein product [Acanthoscelides obtectus]|uniref:HTH psq-type domain-containing protein n=1 Tax=Acanthoscelides obtectus TaxID=200917 RepID=A0A9P0L0D8_ACAOB|nr:unnamed protein product [Acanthoscelides obtectus]CAK1626280.1 hypothetical protein AOBTE_LOCUS3746 [Acanthoscelides obtectus]